MGTEDEIEITPQMLGAAVEALRQSGLEYAGLSGDLAAALEILHSGLQARAGAPGRTLTDDEARKILIEYQRYQRETETLQGT